MAVSFPSLAAVLDQLVDRIERAEREGRTQSQIPSRADDVLLDPAAERVERLFDLVRHSILLPAQRSERNIPERLALLAVLRSTPARKVEQGERTSDRE